jgi:hypothetical protein
MPTRVFATFLVCVLLCAPRPTAAQHADSPARTQTGVVAGRVLSTEADRPLAGARVEFVSTGARIVSDSSGHFRLGGLREGLYRINVRLLGYAPVTMDVRLAPGDTVEADVLLEPVAQRLSTVRVDSSIAEVHRRFMQEFEERRALRMGGVFLDSEYLRKNDTRQLEALIRENVPGVKVVDGIPISRRLGGFNSRCAVQVVVNEQFAYRGNGGGYQLNQLLVQDLLGVEFHGPGSTPLRYGGTSIGKEGGPQCGTLIIWTK